MTPDVRGDMVERRGSAYGRKVDAQAMDGPYLWFCPRIFVVHFATTILLLLFLMFLFE